MIPTASFRFPGLQPFRQSDTHLFFGRSREVRDLFNLIRVEKMVVLFSKSGLGKTSLVNAGLVPVLDKTGGLLPIIIRLNDQQIDLKEQFLLQLKSAGTTVHPRYYTAKLWEIVKYADFGLPDQRWQPLLIFDQFEELFTLYTDEKRAGFVEEFADLINGRMPDEVQNYLREQIAANVMTPADIELWERPPRLKVMFVIRADMLHLLNGLSRTIPDILRSRFELSPLNFVSATEAITRPAALTGPGFISPSFQFDANALSEILTKLSKNKTEEIESFQLQILCQYIERAVIDMPSAESILITPSFYQGPTGIEDILTNFYSDQIDSLPAALRINARRMIEEGLITENERRRSMDRDDLMHDFQVSEDLLEQLVEMRLLRKEPRMRTFYYEISHDTLVPPILVKYRERRQEEEQQAEIERMKREQVEQQKQIAEERRKRAQSRTLAVTGFTLSFIAFLASLIAFSFYREAKRALSQYEYEANKRRRLEIIQLRREAETYRQAGEPEWELKTLRQALEKDSLLIDIRARIQEMETNLNRQK